MMTGKTVMVTGATNGIGKVAARELARMGARVIVVSRSRDKCADTVAHIQAETGNQDVSYYTADLSSLAEIRQLAADFTAEHDRLDVLLNNAGAYFSDRRESVDGHEMTFALNHLNYFLLTHLLLGTLKRTADEQGEARIVNVSSDAHRFPNRVNFEDIERRQRYNGFRVYGESKLMNVLFTFRLAEELDGTGVTANVLHPGFVRTGFGHNNNGLMSLLTGAMQIFAITAEDGAKSSIYLASSPDVKGVTGTYYDSKQKAVAADKAAQDRAAQDRLWQLSLEITGLQEPAPVTV